MSSSLLALPLAATSLLSLLLSSPLHAQQAAPIRLTQPAPASLRLRLDNPALAFCQVRVVRNCTGQPLFLATSQQAAYGHRFDFDNVPSGSYTLEVCLGTSCTVYAVQVRTKAHRSTITACVPTTRQCSLDLALGSH